MAPWVQRDAQAPEETNLIDEDHAKVTKTEGQEV